MNKIITAIYLLLFVGSILQPSISFAQTGNNGYYNNGTQNTRQNNGIGSGSTNNTNNDNYAGTNTFDWRWLLPLLAIPVIYFIWRAASAPDEETGEQQTQYAQPAIGIKGGRASEKKNRKRKKGKKA